MRSARVGRALCLAGAALGALGLLGWAGRLPLLFTVVPGLPAMMPNAAVALILVGVVGAVLQRTSMTPARRVLSSFAVLPVLVIGVGSLAEYTLGTGPLIDQVIFRGELLPYPARTSPLTALALTLIGLGILLIDARAGARARPSEWLLIFAALTALAGLATLVLGTGAVYHLAPAPVPAMAALTAVGLLLTSVGLLMHRPDVGIMAVVTSVAPGGVMFRRLAAPAVVLPTVLAFILTRLFIALRIEELPLVIATVGVALTLLSLVIVGITARLLNDTQAALDASQARTHQLIAHASDGILIADRARRFTEVNDAICRLLGLSERELLGRTADDFIAPDEVNRVAAWRRELREGRTPIAEWHLRHRNGTYVPVEVSATILPDGRLEAFVRDISKRKAAEDESQRAQARIEGIISIATDAIISIDDQQRIIIFNQGAEHTFGWTKGEAVGRTIDFLIPERFRERHHLHVRAFAAEDASARRAGERGVPIYGLRKDGTEFPAEAAISRLRIADELTFTVVLRDLTERARLELELREARGFLENVLESSTDYSLVALDLDRRVLLWNEGARRIFGYTAQEMTGASADVLHPPADLASGVALSLYARALDQGSAEALMRRRRKDGSTFLARLVVSRRTDPGGKASGYLLISKDVTREQRRVEQDQLLAAIGLLLTSSLERAHVMDGAAELLVHNFADLCIVDLVDDAGSGLSISRSRVVHHDARKKTLALALQEVVLEGRRADLAAATLKSRRTTLVSHVTPEYLDSVAQSDEHRRLLRDLAPVSLITVPLEARATLLGALTLVSSDPTRRYEEDDASFVEQIALRVALSLDNARLFETATNALATRDEVLGVVAHDLRNPLGTIMMQASLLAPDEATGEHDGRKAAGVIARAAGRMNHLIQDLLDVARLESGHLSVKPAAVSGRSLVCDAVDAQRGLAAKASLELRADVPTDLPDVWADRDRILQVFENLIGNATRFTKPGGRITAGATQHDGEVLFWVKDNGEGIPAADIPRVFERFWQRKKGSGGGAGLGLPIVKGLVESQGGRVWVESSPETGSTFFFTMPVARPSADRRAAPERRGARRDRRHGERQPT